LKIFSLKYQGFPIQKEKFCFSWSILWQCKEVLEESLDWANDNRKHWRGPGHFKPVILYLIAFTEERGLLGVFFLKVFNGEVKTFFCALLMCTLYRLSLFYVVLVDNCIWNRIQWAVGTQASCSYFNKIKFSTETKKRNAKYC